MLQSLMDFEKISKAISSSYELLGEEQTSISGLQEAEESLNQAINYVLSQHRIHRKT